MTEKKLKEEIIYQGKILKLKKDLVELENGIKSEREIVIHNGGVGILALTERNTVILIKQFRYAFNQEIIEIPAGKLELNEDPRVAALRELQEETGIIANKLTSLGVIYPTVGYSTEKIHLFKAEELVFGPKSLDEDEDTEVLEITLNEAFAMIKMEKIVDAKTIVALLSQNVV